MFFRILRSLASKMSNHQKPAVGCIDELTKAHTFIREKVKVT
jgi:hypothetical protein